MSQSTKNINELYSTQSYSNSSSGSIFLIVGLVVAVVFIYWAYTNWISSNTTMAIVYLVIGIVIGSYSFNSFGKEESPKSLGIVESFSKENA